jgi:hypothetical protein
MNNNVVKLLLTGVFLTSGSGVFAADEWITGKIDRTLSDTANYGKCMIRFPNYQFSNACAAEWVSMDCGGNFNSKEDARRMWDSAQMAYALDLNVIVQVPDTNTVNGYCVAVRLDVAK